MSNKYKDKNPKTTPPVEPKKRFNDKGNVRGKSNKEGKKPAPKKYEGPDQYLTNSYMLGVTITPNAELSDEEKANFNTVGPFKNFPFYVVDRMRMKTVVSIVQVIADYEKYCHMSYQTTKEGAIRAFFGDNEDAFKAYRRLYYAVNWKTIGITPEVDTTDNKIICYNENGDLVVWYRDKRDKPDKRMPATNEWALIEKADLELVNNFLKDFFDNSSVYADAIALRDELALKYMDWVCRSCTTKV